MTGSSIYVANLLDDDTDGVCGRTTRSGINGHRLTDFEINGLPPEPILSEVTGEGFSKKIGLLVTNHVVAPWVGGAPQVQHILQSTNALGAVHARSASRKHKLSGTAA
jgi:hypothetical protein